MFCVLELVRGILRPDADAVVLTSHDGEFESAFDEELSLRGTKVEKFCWFDPVQLRRLVSGRQVRINLYL